MNSQLFVKTQNKATFQYLKWKYSFQFYKIFKTTNFKSLLSVEYLSWMTSHIKINSFCFKAVRKVSNQLNTNILNRIQIPSNSKLKIDSQIEDK